MDVSGPAAATGALAIGCAGVAAAVVVGASALKDVKDVDVAADAVGDTGRLIGGCRATAPDALNGAKVVVPVDVAAVSTGNADADGEDGAAIDVDVKVAGVAVAGTGVTGACAVEPNVEADAPVVDGITAGASVDAGVEARESEPSVRSVTPAGDADAVAVTGGADAAGCDGEADAVPVTPTGETAVATGAMFDAEAGADACAVEP